MCAYRKRLHQHSIHRHRLPNRRHLRRRRAWILCRSRSIHRALPGLALPANTYSRTPNLRWKPNIPQQSAPRPLPVPPVHAPPFARLYRRIYRQPRRVPNAPLPPPLNALLRLPQLLPLLQLPVPNRSFHCSFLDPFHPYPRPLSPLFPPACQSFAFSKSEFV